MRGRVAGFLVLLAVLAVWMLAECEADVVDPPKTLPPVTVDVPVAEDDPATVTPTGTATVMPTGTARATFTPWPTRAATVTATVDPVLLPETGEVLDYDPAQADVPEVELSGAGLAAVVGMLLSLLMAYVLQVRAWWEACGKKREILAGAGFLVAWALVGGHYAGAIVLRDVGPFGWPVVWRVIEAWLAFSGAGQLMFTVEKLTSNGA